MVCGSSYLQYDYWWYRTDGHLGVIEWTSNATVFPHGMQCVLIEFIIREFIEFINRLLMSESIKRIQDFDRCHTLEMRNTEQSTVSITQQQ